MASCSFLLLLFSFISTSHFSDALILPVAKDASTLQYTTTIHHGTPLVPTTLVLDLSGPFLSKDCSSSSSRRPIHSRSILCSTANGPGPTCGLFLENPITRRKTWGWGDLVEDIIIAVDHSKFGSISTVHHQFLYYCTPTFFLKGLASGTKGILGLGRSRMALPSQFAMAYGFDRKFSICLSASSDGIINFGGGPYTFDSNIDISKSLMYTPLVANKGGGDTNEEYFIHVKSIKINDERILLNTTRESGGGTKLSTIVPFTTMESSLFDTFTKAYIKVATTTMNVTMTRVAGVAPFRVCFSSKNIGSTKIGPLVPTIDLVLQSEMMKWRIYGRNSMVRVNDEVMCLGFLDGGSNMRTSIVIGGYQLEDNLLQFDLATSMLGFSSSLLARGTTCSNLQNYTHHVSL